VLNLKAAAIERLLIEAPIATYTRGDQEKPKPPARSRGASSLPCEATSERILHDRREMLEQYSNRTGYLTATPATNGAI
jgi:hypothetical protein